MGRDTIQLENAVSTISQEYFLEFTSEYRFLEGLHSELPGPEEMIVDFPEGNVERVSSNDDDTELSPDIQGNDDSRATSMDENNTHPEDIVQMKQNLLVTSMRTQSSTLKLNICQFTLLEDNKDKVCKLVNSLYGLKQAPRKWNEKLVTVLKENVVVQSVNDHSLFTKSKNNKFTALLIYVDDIVVTGNCMNEIKSFKSFLKSKFNIKDFGSLKYFLGNEVIKIGNDLCLSQRKYCLELLKEYSLLGCKPVSTPMEPNFVLPYVATSDDSLLDNITRYQKLLDVLRYLKNASGKG
nr:ribonuclease H-like domain-containing protein [Tanacetum cinerariifolium]